MSGVLHPQGPDPAETYWVRRALVVGVLLVLIIGLLIFLFNLGGRPGQAAPPAATGVPSADATTGASPTASSDPTTDPSAEDSSSASATPSTATSASSPTEEKSSQKKSGQKDRKTDPSSTPSTDDQTDEPAAKKKSGNGPADDDTSGTKKESGGDDSDKGKDDSDEDKAGSSQADDEESAEPQTAACDPADLRPTLTSKARNVGAGESVRFKLSMINGSSTSCRVEIDSDNYELKIYSGTDRIWSTNDCAKLVPSIDKRVKPEEAVSWATTWNGKRSQKGETCQNRPEIPLPGHYYATSQLEGAKPVQFLLILH